jgi:signal transduction histidine kinase
MHQCVKPFLPRPLPARLTFLALSYLDPLLSMADVCLSSLREVLDSVLTFSKLANSEVSFSNATIAPPTTTVDLESIVVAVVQSVWAGARFKRSALEAAAEYSALQAPTTPLGSPGKVDLILEYNLPPGTTAQVDVGAQTRVLSNLISNAHKHTSNGSIVVVVSAMLQSVIEGTTQVHIDVADTGSSFFTPPSILLFRRLL